MSERWKPVVGWENLYSVSSHGNVRREARWTVSSAMGAWGKPVVRHRLWPRRALKVNLDSGGYAQVVLQDVSSGRRETWGVHRLVLTAFRREPTEADHAMHKNDLRSDNRLSNLRWGTRQENAADMASKGRKRGGGVARYVPAEAVAEIQASPHAPIQELATRYGTSKSNISKIRAKARQ